MISPDLLAEYDLHAPEAVSAIENAISSVLSKSFNMDIMVNVGEALEVIALNNRQIDLSSLSRQIKRQIRYQIERELEKRQILREWDILRSMRGQPITGVVHKISKNGDLTVDLQIEDHFRNLILTGICPARQIPLHEKNRIQPGTLRTFLVTSVLPVWERQRAKVLIRLSRTSRVLPELLLQQQTDESGIRCRRRIAGAFSEIETPRRIPKEAILSVGKELGERIIVRVVAQKKAE